MSARRSRSSSPRAATRPRTPPNWCTMDLEELPAVVDPEAALRPDSPIVHERFETNLIGAFSVGSGDVDAALARAPHRLQAPLLSPPLRRGADGMPRRRRAYDPRTDSVTIWSSTQVVHWVRREAAALLGLPEARVRCVALDVGGGFGGKGHVYPEDLLITFLARRLGRPVRWIEERREHLMSATHSRDQLHDVEVGFDDDGRILAIRDDYIVDCGAWNPIGSGVAYNTAVHLTGPYKIENLAASGRIVVTNKVPNAPYRGAGRPEAAFAMERTIDLVARTLGLEPAEVRRRNMIRADEMPYRVGIPYRDGEPIVYDSGDYPGALEKALDAVGGVAAFRRRQERGAPRRPLSRARHRLLYRGHRGRAVRKRVCPHRPVRQDLRLVRRLPAGPGHGDDLLADRRRSVEGRARGRRRVARRHRGDRDRLRHDGEPQHGHAVGGDAPCERAAARQGLRHRRQSAGMCAGRSRIARWRRRRRRRAGRDGEPRQDRAGGASGLGERPPAGGRGRARGDLLLAAADRHLELCACMSRSSRSTARPAGSASRTTRSPTIAASSSTRCWSRVRSWAARRKGSAASCCEAIAYDANGQLLSGSLMDYALPIAGDMPAMQILHQHSPSPLNPLGVKGVGEGGAVAPPAAIANAVCDALAPFGVEMNATPIRPEQLVRAMRPR